MKWLPATPPTQHTADRRYCIVQATESGNWVAYRMHATTGEPIGVAQPTDIQARNLCEQHEASNK